MALITAAVKSDNSVITSSRAILTAVQLKEANLESLINLIDIEVKYNVGLQKACS